MVPAGYSRLGFWSRIWGYLQNYKNRESVKYGLKLSGFFTVLEDCNIIIFKKHWFSAIFRLGMIIAFCFLNTLIQAILLRQYLLSAL